MFKIPVLSNKFPYSPYFLYINWAGYTVLTAYTLYACHRTSNNKINEINGTLNSCKEIRIATTLYTKTKLKAKANQILSAMYIYGDLRAAKKLTNTYETLLTCWHNNKWHFVAFQIDLTYNIHYTQVYMALFFKNTMATARLAYCWSKCGPQRFSFK